jgi:phosphatidylglycerophosphatase A
MLVLVLLALRGAGVTKRGANSTEVCDEAGISADECGAIPANVRAINTESRAFRHLAQTLIAAGFALFRTSDTSFHTGLILMSHWKSSLC